MRILFVRRTPLGAPGDADAHYMPATLARSGHSVAIVARSGGDSSFLAEAGVRVIEVVAGKSWHAALRDAVRLVRPYIVHVFIHAGCGLYPLLMKSASGPKFVLDIRSPLLRTGLLRYMVQLKNRLEVVGYDAITAHAVESAWTVVGREREIYWVPPGVDLAAIPVTDEKKPAQAPMRLVYVGSLDRRRKVPQMILGVLNAAQTLPLTLHIYGDGEDRQKIETVLRQNSSEQVVRFMGVLPRNELFTRLLSYDIGLSYVPKALYDPAPPLKTLEYLASGLPTIATNTAGNARFIKDGENGLLVGDDARSIADGILRLCRDRVLCEKLACNARPSVAQYDWKRIVKDRLLPLYEQLLRDIA